MQVFEAIDWSTGPAPVADALEKLAREVQRFDVFHRVRLAQSDMELAERAALALIDADENDGPARMFRRVLETGLVVTFTRPFLDSSERRCIRSLPSDRWRPQLIKEIADLRDEYHAHSDQTERRQIIDSSAVLGMSLARPTYSEAWEELSVESLQRIADVASREAKRLGTLAEEAREEISDA